MGISDRLFVLPPADAAPVEARLGALRQDVRQMIERAGALLAGADPRAAQPLLVRALAAVPDQPDALRLFALWRARTAGVAAARDDFEKALQAAPDDALVYWQYAHLREEAGEIAAALALRERAVRLRPDSPAAWTDLGEHLFRHQQVEAALAPLERAVSLAPEFAPALLKLGNAYIACGRIGAGAMMLRRALRSEPAFGAAWLGLVDAKTIALTPGELAQMHHLLDEGGAIDAGERTAIEFAFAMACERAGDYAEAWQRAVHANAQRKRELRPWSREGFLEREKRAAAVFAAPHACAPDTTLGAEVIFIVGMPRSGTTLVEQILASHPAVCGAGELAALPQVLTEESSRRRQRYPDWVPAAGADDWARMGRRYLELTAAVRGAARVVTDKLPVNWRALGAIRAMLPGARIVICRRDPLENCWSCFKQYFGRGWEYTYDVEDLATVWQAFDRAATYWVEDDPRHIHEQHYEALTIDPETEIRAMLIHCGLSWDPSCLQFAKTQRSVRTLSATQVREPMHRHRELAVRYGSLLDPLRTALGIPTFGEGAPG